MARETTEAPDRTKRAGRRAVITDFDGTVTQEDVAEFLLDAFAGPAWIEIENLVKKRRIGTRESMARQFALVHAREEDLLALVDRRARMDESFRDFLAFCRDRDVRVEIVSEGLDFYIRHLLRKWDLALPVRTNRVTFADGRVLISYPWADPTCTLCGACKLRRVFELRAEGYRVAYVGDGSSDLCPAIEADLVFAKGELARLCEEEGIEFMPFDSFADVTRRLGESW